MRHVDTFGTGTHKPLPHVTEAEEPHQDTPPPAAEIVRFDSTVLVAVSKDVARLADAAEAMLALYRAEIERTRR